MNYVVRLHRNLGHPGSNVLCKMLEEVQATENVMTAARGYVCPGCFIRQGPAGVPPASGLTARVFGEDSWLTRHGLTRTMVVFVS